MKTSSFFNSYVLGAIGCAILGLAYPIFGFYILYLDYRNKKRAKAKKQLEHPEHP